MNHESSPIISPLAPSREQLGGWVDRDKSHGGCSLIIWFYWDNRCDEDGGGGGDIDGQFISKALPPETVNWDALPSDNDKAIYNDGEGRIFPRDLYIDSSVNKFNTGSLNSYSGLMLNDERLRRW